MSSEVLETEGEAVPFWRDFPAMTDYFSPVLVQLLKYPGYESKQAMREFGEQLGRKAAAKTAPLSLDRMLDESARVWQMCKIGTLAIETRNPIAI